MYFAHHCGIDFNTGSPFVLYDGRTDLAFSGVGAICDSIGNLLFYSGTDTVYTHQHTIMVNGTNFLASGGTQSSLIIPCPGSHNMYYIFKTANLGDGWGLYYNVVDMNMNNGLGSVIEKNIQLNSTWDAADKITATLHENKRDIWLITRKYIENKFAVFLISPEGISEEPSLYDAINIPGDDSERGYMKISFDKKYLFAAYEDSKVIEVCSFNHNSGEIEFLFELNNGNNPLGLEFSPDSKFAYIAYRPNTPTLPYEIRQFNMENISIPWLFLQSSQVIGTGYGLGLQLATNGKIYCFGIRSTTVPDYYIGIIHNPWEHGSNCAFEYEAINLFPGEASQSIPNIFMDFLYRFEFDGICESDTFFFQSNFNPIPDSIRWHFNDFGSGINNISYGINPIHIFSDGGLYEVEVDVWYPSGRFEHTSRRVEVEYSPELDLGPDTTFCSTEGIKLDAECGPHLYTWSTGAFGVSQITAYDTGWYWVRVENDAGCFEIDSIHLASYPPALADTTDLEVIPTTCGGSTGVIRGLQFSGSPPFSHTWTNDMGDTIATSLSIFHLPVGNYTIQVSDGNGCTTPFGPYTIHDAGDVLIESVQYSNEHCSQQDAGITVTATSGLTDMLFYSLDNGNTYFNNQGLFTGLSAGNYAVRVKDSSDCQDVYSYNPIIIQNIDGPEITNISIGPCASGQSNGFIEISALGSGDTIYYSNDNGLNFQVNDGGFYNLVHGYYTCLVLDEAGCDTSFIVEVPEEITIHLQAMAGEDEVCPGNAAFVPLTVSNFNDVAYFKTTLVYDHSKLTCTGFANAHISLQDSLQVILFPAEGKAELTWHSAPVTLPDNTKMADIVFQSLDPGLSMVSWDGSTAASLFLNSSGLTIPVDYFLGSVRIFKEVFFTLGPGRELCQGDDLAVAPMLWSSNGEVSYYWTGPAGLLSTSDTLSVGNIQLDQSGTCSLRLTDTLGCYADDSFDVLVHPVPVPAFSAQDTIITTSPVEIDAGQNHASYLWSTGETSRFITAVHEGWYGVLIASLQGCYGNDSVYVRVNESINENIFIPNAFSPNNDGLNDEFRVVTSSDNIRYFRMQVFNRWGMLVFESHDISRGWDGRYKSDPAPSGAYVYKIEYASGTSMEELQTISGILVLVR
ncbi:MAG: gliding motility-associated C-terminal domain-containing protein [Bacteroidota bacterium]|nr:gliding motility-associated C-terminal domain-containing protein [Bacteroidota bacterium]